MSVDVCPSNSATWAMPTPFPSVSVTNECWSVYDTTPFRCGSFARRFRTLLASSLSIEIAEPPPPTVISILPGCLHILTLRSGTCPLPPRLRNLRGIRGGPRRVSSHFLQEFFQGLPTRGSIPYGPHGSNHLSGIVLRGALNES